MQELLKNYIQKELLSDQSDLDIGEDDNLLLEGLVDSLGMMQLIDFIEDKTDLTIPPEHVTIENFSTINLMSNYILKCIEKSKR